jgi:hypothetical protein
MTLLLILSAPLIAVVVSRWAWRFHLRALSVLGPGLATMAGAPAPASTLEVVSVLVEDDTVMVGLRPAPTGPPHAAGTSLRAPVSTVVLSVAGVGCGPVARLQRWQASEAPVLVWHDRTDDAVDFCQLSGSGCPSSRVRPGAAGRLTPRPMHRIAYPKTVEAVGAAAHPTWTVPRGLRSCSRS